MTKYLSSDNFADASPDEARVLADGLETLLRSDYDGDFYALLGRYQRILADNNRRAEWPALHEKLRILFLCGKAAPLDGPMIGIPVSIRDSDYFVETARLFGKERSIAAGIEWMATAWNASFADTGLWMGKTYEPVSRDTVARKTGNDREAMANYDPDTTRIGRNFFRVPPHPGIIQTIGLPGLTALWHLQDRPLSTAAKLYEGQLLTAHLEKERAIPYSKTGGIFLANLGKSVVPEMHGKPVYQLNYRWPELNPVYPMTRLIDEIVQIDEGIYLGQLVFATRHYSLGALDLPFLPGMQEMQLGEAYCPGCPATDPEGEKIDYGYQNNGFFLMMDPLYAKRVYSDAAFPQLRPRPGETGYAELGYEETASTARPPAPAIGSGAAHQREGRQMDWVADWKDDGALREKFTTFILEPSPRESDGDVREMRRDGESVLQMLQRISREISAQSKYDDHLRHFEQLSRLFRCGVAPEVEDGLFKGHGRKGYNTRVNGQEKRDWYGEEESSVGFDYYHGATLNLHWGFAETFRPDRDSEIDEGLSFPGALATVLRAGQGSGPNLLNTLWGSIGKYIFPWAGKSFEKVSGRKLSMLLDESGDLAERYPGRVHELKTHLASAPHYDLVLKNHERYWKDEGRYAPHLKSGPWDAGMPEVDKAFWIREAAARWVFGNNIQDARILAADPLMRLIDMNYRTPDPSLQAVSEDGPSPFARQGYIFLGAAGQESIMPMNNGETGKKRVFQFHYRYPMIGGAAPIGYCLDELVEIADGLFLGQLIYSTALHIPFHSSVDPAEYKYQLFGYFLLLDDEWEYHRKAIGLDTVEI
ncbi:MAG: hypothetical protein ACYC05_05080 [Sulfuricella sp.]